jgi:predicted nucleic-acid-binding protein
MIVRAIDTNVAARYILADDPRQAAVAAEVIAGGVHVSITVLLELGWLLGSRFALSRDTIAKVLADFIDLDGVHVENAPGVGWAIDRYAHGADLADMLHLVAAAPADRFVTFHAGIARAAGPAATIAVETLS